MDLLNNQEENKANNMDFAGSSRPGFMAALKSHGLALEIHKLSNYNQTCVRVCVRVCVCWVEVNVRTALLEYK